VYHLRENVFSSSTRTQIHTVQPRYRESYMPMILSLRTGTGHVDGKENWIKDVEILSKNLLRANTTPQR